MAKSVERNHPDFDLKQDDLLNLQPVESLVAGPAGPTPSATVQKGRHLKTAGPSRPTPNAIFELKKKTAGALPKFWFTIFLHIQVFLMVNFFFRKS
jgi:hypothetical protein